MNRSLWIVRVTARELSSSKAQAAASSTGLLSDSTSSLSVTLILCFDGGENENDGWGWLRFQAHICVGVHCFIATYAQELNNQTDDVIDIKNKFIVHR